MSALVLLVVLLMVLVGLMFVGGLGYAVHRHPTLAQPLTAAVSGAMLLAALVTLVVSTAAR
ncbi:hypothetical protein ACFSJS_16010 [Streptomyces desertarenae]|uniref:Uncharacterized protein n=1 Tax=Streptomyces desertarenae TaxID=2666184 RepID=A0ABW4PM64_9ACTN